MQGACISHLERRDGFYSALLSTDTIGRVTAGSTNPRDRSLRPTREGTLQVELVEQRFSLYRPWHAMHRLSVTQRNRLTSVRGLPSAFGAYVYTVILAQQVKTGKENGDVLSHKTSSHLRATDLPHAPCVQEAIPPPHECLILTHMLQSDTIKDEHTRLVGSQELGRANLWERPTARSASNETSCPSGHQSGRESPGFSACSNAHLERDQSGVSLAR